MPRNTVWLNKAPALCAELNSSEFIFGSLKIQKAVRDGMKR